VPTTSVSRIRQAAVADAPLLARVGSELFAQTFAAVNTPEDLGAYLAIAFNEPRQTQELNDPNMRTWIAESDDGSPAGFVQVRLGAAMPTRALPRPAELARIYVDARWHGAGVGPRLLQ